MKLKMHKSLCHGLCSRVAVLCRPAPLRLFELTVKNQRKMVPEA